MKYIISQSQLNKIQENFNRVITEITYRDLPQNVKSVIDNMNLPVDDSHIRAEKTQEPDAIYPDNGGIDPTAKENLKKLLSDLYSKFPNAPKGTNSNCDNIKGCLSGYRGYKTQASVFSGKVTSRTASGVAQRQKYSALPGFSQHSTGKTFDILSLEPSWWNQNKDIRDWVKNNACVYGFIVSYPKDGPLRKQEDWHIYFTGDFCSKDNQTEIKSEEKITDTKIDQYYASSAVNDYFEKRTVKQFKKSKCKPNSNYSESPTFDEIKSDKTKVIRIGHMGDPVEEVQQILKNLGYDLGNCGIDGLFGPKTKKALEEFQEDNGITISSAIDSITIDKLKSPNKNNSTTKTQTPVKSTEKIKFSGGTQAPSDNFQIKGDGNEEIDLVAIAASGAGGRKSLTLKSGSGRGKEFTESMSKKYYDLKNNKSIEWAVANCSTGQIIANSSNASTNIYGASVPKIVIAAAALHNNGGQVKGEVLGSKEAEWNSIINLLVRSENDPAWTNTQKVAGGKDGVMKFVSQMGYRNMVPTRSPAMINALDMANFYIDVIQGSFKGANAIQKISSASQTSNSRSKVYIPSGTPMGGKTGTWSSYNHDTGWLYYNGQYWSIVVLTTGKSSEDVAIMWGGLFKEYIEK